MAVDGERTVILASSGPSPVRLVLSAPQRPWQDVVVDYLVTVTGDGLDAMAGITSIEGDSRAEYFSGIAERFRGWYGVLEWQSLEGQLRAEANWTNHRRDSDGSRREGPSPLSAITRFPIATRSPDTAN